MASMVRPDESIEVPSVGGREPRMLSRMVLAEIVQPRIEEILELAKHEMEKSGFLEMIPSGIVVTGGSVILDGLPELADQIFDLPVRRGTPHDVGGMVTVIDSPVYTTGVGLVALRDAQPGQRALRAALGQQGTRWPDREPDAGLVRWIF